MAVVSKEVSKLLFERKIVAISTNAALATVFLEKLSQEEIRALEDDFGFDFSKPVRVVVMAHKFPFYKYDLQKVEAYLKANNK